MESMIERVGRAIFASQDWPEFHPAYENSAKDVWEVAAKSAIEAMRIPSYDMISAGEDNVSGKEDVHYIFMSMIDAALKEE